MTNIELNREYINWLNEVKYRIRTAQIQAALAVNSTLIDFYFVLGKMISEKESVWGSNLLENLSADLKEEFPDMQGFSVTNLRYCRLFYNYKPIHPQAGDELQNEIHPQFEDELDQLTISFIIL